MIKRWGIYSLLLVVVFLFTKSQASVCPSVHLCVYVSVLCYSVGLSVIRLFIYCQDVKLFHRAYLSLGVCMYTIAI